MTDHEPFMDDLVIYAEVLSYMRKTFRRQRPASGDPPNPKRVVFEVSVADFYAGDVLTLYRTRDRPTLRSGIRWEIRLADGWTHDLPQNPFAPGELRHVTPLEVLGQQAD